jgi:hypothetical protein
VAVGIKNIFGIQSQISEHGSTVQFVINIRPAGARHRNASRINNMDGNRPSNSTAGVLKRVIIWCCDMPAILAPAILPRSYRVRSGPRTLFPSIEPRAVLEGGIFEVGSEGWMQTRREKRVL